MPPLLSATLGPRTWKPLLRKRISWLLPLASPSLSRVLGSNLAWWSSMSAQTTFLTQRRNPANGWLAMLSFLQLLKSHRTSPRSLEELVQ
ncbi:hypothetical protein EMPG_11063 [Blastomyces silverae]|uniref:Uncharacterized protein n=1 Tax=Blastomyces silverae TaxID=2060906 RepID=A0A0H1B227_9EURO|nr:hypothetical protein EMPG_11063 [Blastomyces silverae]